MSTLVAQTISNGTVSTSSANVIQGSAKAWVNFNGTGTVAIRASYNVSSITDNGVGTYTVNMTNAMPDINYQILATTGGNGSSILGTVNINTNSTGGRVVPTTTAFVLVVSNISTTTFDSPDISATVFR
jgi:hypothetical protein